MMTEQKALNNAKNNYVDELTSLIQIINLAVENLASSESIIEFMSYKQDVMHELSDALSPTKGACPFCQMHNPPLLCTPRCAECPYGKVHGQCLGSSNSAYSRLIRDLGEIEKTINNYWRVEDYVSSQSGNLNQDAA